MPPRSKTDIFIMDPCDKIPVNRISVVWLFCNVINYFKFMDFKKIVKIIGKVCWKIALTILYENTTSNYFQSEHPNLNDECFFVGYFMLYLLK